MEEKNKEKKQSKFGWFMENILNLDGIIISGKYILQLILLFIAINFSLNWFINEAPISLMNSRIFITAFVTGIMLMPIYISYKNMDELGVDFLNWILISGVVIMLILYFLRLI